MTWPTIPPILLSSFKLSAGTTLQQAPDGTQVLQVGNGSNASVDLGITPAQLQAYPPGQAPYVREGTYTLAFEIANSLPKYPGPYDIAISFGAQQLGEFYGWGKEVFAAISAACPGPGYIVIDKALPGGGVVQSSHDLVITVTGNGWPLMLRNFSLTFMPTN